MRFNKVISANTVGEQFEKGHQFKLNDIADYIQLKGHPKIKIFKPWAGINLDECDIKVEKLIPHSRPGKQAIQEFCSPSGIVFPNFQKVIKINKALMMRRGLQG